MDDDSLQDLRKTFKTLYPDSWIIPFVVFDGKHSYWPYYENLDRILTKLIKEKFGIGT